MLYHWIKKVLGDYCVSLTYRSSSLSEVGEADMLSTIQKVSLLLADKVVPASDWARVAVQVRRDLRRAPGQAPAQSSQF